MFRQRISRLRCSGRALQAAMVFMMLMDGRLGAGRFHATSIFLLWHSEWRGRRECLADDDEVELGHDLKFQIKIFEQSLVLLKDTLKNPKTAIFNRENAEWRKHGIL
jgi:hypothetical protein